MTEMLIGASLVALTGFFAVLCGFLHSLRRVLANTANRLGGASATSSDVRRNCATIGPAVRSMNMSLYEVAAHLLEAGNQSEALAERPRP
ncbi:hypothetical protein ACIA03_23400 [Nocardioides sp. NPDC051685]|uniref:hypothetical protein n=1 Tax=Nocardioides sp. NPDC051685 TaxID=3364334 RepID=UPI00379E0E82